MTPVSKKFNAYRGLGNACPVCSSTTGKCSSQHYELIGKNRTSTATTKVFCMGGAGGYGNPDYHYFNDTRDGQWGIYIPLADWNVHRNEYREASQADKDLWVLNNQKRRQDLLDLENQRWAESLDSRGRDIAARAIIDQLSLDLVDRQDLLDRGFTSKQIEQIGFRSVKKWQRLTIPVNNRFPGVDVHGTKLNTSKAGILMPLFAVTGEIQGFQVRNRDKSDEQRYLWLSSSWEKNRSNGASPNLGNGENPLTFVYPQLLGAQLQVNSIGLAEGTGAKPNLAAIKMGQIVIGAAGGQWLSSPQLLKDGLARLRANQLDLYLDGDDLTKPNVIRRWLKLHDQLTEWGYRPRLIWFGAGCDVDESKYTHNYNVLTTEFLGAKLAESLNIQTIDLSSWARKAYRKSRKFTANQTVLSRYLEWEIPNELQNMLVAFKSALGTGKTEILKKLAIWAKQRGLELLFLGYRNNLLRQTCDRIPDLMHVIDEDRIILESDYHKALCHHSAGLLDIDQMANKILIVDECASVLADMLNSKLTAGRQSDGRDSRQVRLKHIGQLIQNSYGVVVLDAYLADTETDFFQELRSFDHVHKIENEFKNHIDVRMVNQRSTVNRAIIDDALAGATLLVTATTQKQCQNLEKALLRVGIDPKSIFRVDSTTDRNDQTKLFFRNPKVFLEETKPQIVIMSPTAESGISIDLAGYFRTHYHFHMGNLGILSGLQFLGRYRDFSAPRVIFCEKRGQVRGSDNSAIEKWVKNDFDDRVKEDISLALELLDLGLAQEAAQVLHNYTSRENVWLKLAHKYRASLNEEMNYLRELFIEAMENDGYTVEIDPEDIEGCDDTYELMGQVEIERRVLQSQQIYNAPDITKLQYEGIRQNTTASESDRLLAAKHYLTEQYLPGVMKTPSYSPELIQIVKYNSPALISQLENYFYLTNPELAQRDRLAAWLPVVATESAWLPDRISKSNLSLIKAARELGLHELLESRFGDDTINKFTEAVISSPSYKSSFGLSLNPNKPVESVDLFRRILRKFGLKLVKIDGQFLLSPLALATMTLASAPKYKLLTPELCDRIRALAGSEYEKTHSEMRQLEQAMAQLEIHDGSGRMRLIGGAARHLGLSVTTRRHRMKVDGIPKITRIYSFHAPNLPRENLHPISQAIANTQVYPENRPVEVADIYGCVKDRLLALAQRQSTQIIEWQANRIRLQSELYAPIQVDCFAEIDKIKLPQHQSGSPMFTLDNLKSVAQSLYCISKMPVNELKQAWADYTSIIDSQVVKVGLEMLQQRYFSLFERLTIAF